MSSPAAQTENNAGPCDERDELGLKGVGFLLGVAHRARRRRWEENLADLGLSAPQAALLRLIAQEPGCGVRQLARRLGTDPMNAQRIIESLINAGLCEPSHDPHDARRRPLHPTQRGNELAATVKQRAQTAEQLLVDALGAEGYQAIVTMLNNLIRFDAGSQGEI